MITLFSNLLKDHNFHFECEIRNVHKSCCNSNIKVIDFDKVKEDFCALIKIGTPASCDCLLMDLDNNDMIFVEMKNINEVLVRNKHKFSNFESFMDFVKVDFNSYRFDNKIIDSYALLLAFAGYFSMDKSFFANILNSDGIGVKFFILVNVSAEDYLAYFFENLDNIDKFKYRFLKHVSIIRSEDFDTHFKYLCPS